MHRLFPRAMRAGALAVAVSLVLAATITVPDEQAWEEERRDYLLY